MILIDSVHINNGGGKILLDYLVDMLEVSGKDIFYLFDERCRNQYPSIPEERKLYLRGSLSGRHRFYKRYGGSFSSVLCFGNLAPTTRLPCKVYTYFHQSMYLSVPKEFGLRDQILFRLKTLVFAQLLRNTDYLLLQSDYMKEQVHEKFGIDVSRIKVLPFYDDRDLSISGAKESNSFIYVSGGAEHKNHQRLIVAFKNHYRETGKGKLYLTVPKDNQILTKLIERSASEGIPIINIGFVPRSDLLHYYATAEYLVFPSLRESFGLGIIEAIRCGCKVIGADLPYMHQVCQPSILFDPLDVDDIERALGDAVKKKEQHTIPHISNRIDELIALLN